MLIHLQQIGNFSTIISFNVRLKGQVKIVILFLLFAALPLRVSFA